MNCQIAPHETIADHGFAIKVRNWARYADRSDEHVIAILSSLLRAPLDHDSTTATYLSRKDVANAFNEDVAKGVVAAILWGYPKGRLPGGRGFDRLFHRLSEIAAIVHELRSQPPIPADQICALFAPFDGLGPSTFTKLLYFAGVKAEEGRCLIYDQMVMRSIAVAERGAWAELGMHFGNPLKPQGGYRMFAQKRQIESYGAYLQIAEQVAGSSAAADVVELELFVGAPKGRRTH